MNDNVEFNGVDLQTSRYFWEKQVLLHKIKQPQISGKKFRSSAPHTGNH